MEARHVCSQGPVQVVDFDRHPHDRLSLIRHCADLIRFHKTADRAWGATGPVHARRELMTVAPALGLSTAEGRRSVDRGPGYIVFRGTHVERCEDELAQLVCLFISTAFGTPTRTDKTLQRFAWPVRYEKTHYRSPTFSQTMAGAAFHTDSQYLDEPERYFGLFCVASDVRGQGTNFLVSRSQVVEKLNESHPAVLDHLKSPFPFRVPSVFTTSASDDEIEVVWAPILAGRILRFRRDTITSALCLPGVTVSDAQMAAMDVLERAISEAPSLEYHLEPGEALIVDNHSMLHARSPFSDRSRLLYRVRMQEQDPDACAEQREPTDISRKPRENMEDQR